MKNKKVKIIIIASIVILLCSLGGFCVFNVINNDSKNPEKNKDATPTDSIATNQNVEGEAEITTEFPLPVCLSENTYTLNVPGEGSGNIKSCEVEKKEEGRYEIRFKTFSFTAVYDEKNDEYVVEDFFGIDGNRVRASVRKNNDGTYTVKALGYTVTAVCDEKSEKVSISAKEEIKIYLDYDKKAVVDAKSEEYVADYLNDEPYDNEEGTEVADNDAADGNNTSSNTTSSNGNNTSGSHGNNGSGGNNSGNTGNGSGNTTSSSSSGNNSSSGNTTSSSGNNTSSSGNNNSNTTSNNNNSNTTSSDPNAGKTWVEPVYDWVWHKTGTKIIEEPVYETVSRVYCNECGMDFGTSEDAFVKWQNHRDEIYISSNYKELHGSYTTKDEDVQVGTTQREVEDGEWVYEIVVPGHWE